MDVRLIVFDRDGTIGLSAQGTAHFVGELGSHHERIPRLTVFRRGLSRWKSSRSEHP
jgi:hypothetical protein